MKTATAYVRSDHVATLVDLLKLLRSQSLTREEVARHMGVQERAAEHWLEEMVAQGIVLQTRKARSADSGRGAMPLLHRLAPEWGGPAA